MTTKVRIEFPENNHAPMIVIRVVYPHNMQDAGVLATLTQGGVYEGYVHSHQHLVIEEKFE